MNPEYNKGQKAHRIPLGQSYIAAALIKAGHKVTGFNLDVDKEPDFRNYNLFGVYLSTPMLKQGLELIKKLEGYDIVVGGPHPSADKEFLKEVKAVGIEGEGEVPFVEIANRLDKQNGDMSGIPGVFFYKDGELKCTPSQRPPELDTLPIPAREVFDHGNYPNRRFAYSAIVASRGCPFRCKNCQPGLMKISPYRIRKAEKVVEEMMMLNKKYGVIDFSFEDSELIITKAWTLKLCDEIIKNKLKVTFQGNARLHQLDDEVLKKLKEAGCRRLGVGLESGSQYVLSECLNKDINLESDLNNINRIKKYGIEAHVWIMIGIPGEKEEDIKKTIEVVKSLDVSTVEINIATPWPGTYFYDESKEKGWIIESEAKDFDEKRLSFFKTPWLTPERVSELFEEFKKELKQNGWVQWSHESNTFARKPTFIEVIKKAYGKIKRREVYLSDFRILKDWIKNVANKV